MYFFIIKQNAACNVLIFSKGICVKYFPLKEIMFIPSYCTSCA